MNFNLHHSNGNLIDIRPINNHYITLTDYILFDYYFMATRFTPNSEEICLKLWTIIIDSNDNKYAMRSYHIGHFSQWENVIKERIIKHLNSVHLSDYLNKILPKIEINKKHHIIKWDFASNGNKIGIDGSDEIFIREVHIKKIYL